MMMMMIIRMVLKVTDEAGQSDEDDVKVYVKPPTNLPPVAEAGPDLELSLPLPWITLDGSKSHDDGNITEVTWSLLAAPPGNNFISGLLIILFPASGSGAPVIQSPGEAVTNVTSLGVRMMMMILMMI